MESLKIEDIDLAEIYNQLETIRTTLYRHGVQYGEKEISIVLTRAVLVIDYWLYPADMRNMYLKKK